MLKNYLIIGADTCIGYALCKRLTIEKEFCICGINTRFNHYGNKCFQYAFNRNVYDEAEVYKNNDCRLYLMDKSYDAIFWCDSIWTEDEDATICGRVTRFFQFMDGIKYKKLFFWVRETGNPDGTEPKFSADRSTAIKIPNLYGIYQERGDIIPRIILNDITEEFHSSEALEKFISAWSIAEAVIDNHFTDLQKYTFSVPLKNLVLLLEHMKKNEMLDFHSCRKLLLTDDVGKVRRIIYYLFEAIEFYTSNELYYRNNKTGYVEGKL